MSEDMTGKTIGNFKIEKEIGRGGMGVVYRATEPALGRTVALKVLPANLASNEAFIQRFNREARAVAQLNHPNVVTIYTIGEDKGEKFLAMEYVDGRDLSAIIREHGPMDLRRSLEIIRQCAGALAAAHQRGIIHRDIKPHNIMLDDDDRPKVMDFGIAKLSEEMTSALTRTGDILGTPAYMSPEQCRGKQLDGRSDLYSLGVVLYQMLTGRLPFSGDTPVTVIQKILFEEPTPIREFNPDVPPAVVHMIERCMAKEPDERYPDCRQFARDLERFLAGDHGIPATELTSATSAPTRVGPSKLVREVRAEMPTAKHQAQAFKGRASETTAPPVSPAIPNPAAKSAVASVLKMMILGGVAAGLLIGGAIFGVKQLVGDKKRGKGLGEGELSATLETPIPVGTLVSTPARTHLPPPAPESAEIAFTEAPGEGSRIKEKSARVAWRIKNNALVEGFLVGLNEPNPKVKLTDTSKTFEFSAPGVQTITIIPLLADGQRGEPLTRRFTYQPNRPPTLSANFASPKIIEGDTAKLLAVAKDPDGDMTTIESDVNGSGWMVVFNGERTLANLRAGKHRVRVRALDPDGAVSDEWSGELVVLAKEAALSALPSPVPAVDASLLAGGGEHISQALVLSQGTRADYPFDRARELLQTAATTNDPLAQMLLAKSLQRGDFDFAPDPQKAESLAKAALPVVEQKAQARDPYAAWLLASAKEEGLGTPKDSIEAVHWYNQAAKLGHPAAMNDLGWIYDTGAGVSQNPTEAFGWFLKGAEAGNVNAMYNLAVCYEEGQGTKADAVQAADWYRRAAELGHTGAMHNLGGLYLNGRGGKRDETEAIRWYLRAANAGDADAMNSAAWMYEEGMGTPARWDEALRLYQRAADAGNAAAMCNLARMHDEGKATQRNPKEALALYLKAAQYGNAKAMYNLGVSFDRGEGLARDPGQAAYWYTKSAEAGHPAGMFMLGWINETGTSGTKDPARAVEWYQRSARLGNTDAQMALQRLGKSW